MTSQTGASARAVVSGRAGRGSGRGTSAFLAERGRFRRLRDERPGRLPQHGGLDHSGGHVLVVGHSDTVPQIISEFGGPSVSIGGDEYDNLYVLTICRCRWQGVDLTNLQYGAASP